MGLWCHAQSRATVHGLQYERQISALYEAHRP